MPLASPKYPFEEWAISGAPEDRGLYALYRHNELICVGVAMAADKDETIRSRLFVHFHGGARAHGVTYYQWEIARDPMAARAEYLLKLARGLPACEGLPLPPAE